MDTSVLARHREQRTLASLQAGRALAALAVVFHHANMSAVSLIGHAPGFAHNLEYGTLGVDFFFVLSGFIIYYSSVNDRKDAPWVRGFLIRRAIRIYLPYWPVGIGIAAIYTLVPGLGDGAHQFSWVSTLSLIPTLDLPALIPAWTLQHEVFFYLVFAMLMWLRVFWLGLAIWITVLVALWWPNGPDGNVVLAAMNLEFIFGILAAYVVVHGHVRHVGFALVGVMLVGAFFVAGQYSNSVIFGAGMAFLIAVAADCEKRGLLKVPVWLIVLGNASYAIYLVHNPLLALTTRASSRVAQDWWLAMGFGIAVSIAAGLLYYFCYEAPTLRAAQSYLRRFPTSSTMPSRAER